MAFLMKRKSKNLLEGQVGKLQIKLANTTSSHTPKDDLVEYVMCYAGSKITLNFS